MQRLLECATTGKLLSLSRLVSSWGRTGRCCSHPFLPRSPYPERQCLLGTGTPHPSRRQRLLVTQQRPVERRPPPQEKHNSEHKNVSSFSAASPCRWSPGTSKRLSSRPNSAAIERGSPHPQGLPGTPGLLLRLQLHPPRHKESQEGIWAPLETVGTECPLAGRKGTRDNLGVPEGRGEGPAKATGSL